MLIAFAIQCLGQVQGLLPRPKLDLHGPTGTVNFYELIDSGIFRLKIGEHEMPDANGFLVVGISGKALGPNIPLLILKDPLAPFSKQHITRADLRLSIAYSRRENQPDGTLLHRLNNQLARATKRWMGPRGKDTHSLILAIHKKLRDLFLGINYQLLHA